MNKHHPHTPPSQHQQPTGEPLPDDVCCLNCGYSLGGLTVGMACPECGEIIPCEIWDRREAIDGLRTRSRYAIAIQGMFILLLNPLLIGALYRSGVVIPLALGVILVVYVCPVLLGCVSSGASLSINQIIRARWLLASHWLGLPWWTLSVTGLLITALAYSTSRPVIMITSGCMLILSYPVGIGVFHLCVRARAHAYTREISVYTSPWVRLGLVVFLGLTLAPVGYGVLLLISGLREM